ncbi:hypothetical protein [Flavobacterium frigoris]|uniref:ATP-binding protein n=1 Tax=Flavobacterium frigoris TaxID=229204 RepID=A0A1H9MVW3_FLAFI|nr:hypothetical protein [Flavobacterium frigoris]SER27808.1 hypothetical protein SAMN05444355_10940 [Flavobacterium frigoris]
MNTITKTSKNFSPSVNIIRDNEIELNYIVTPNSHQAFIQIAQGFNVGTRVFNLVGAYGIGKSAFLKAFQSDARKTSQYFNHQIASQVNDFEVMQFVGTYNSLHESFSDFFKLKNSTIDLVIENLDKFYNGLRKNGKGLIIFIDEFGKYLEFAARNNPENELYFIQQLAEYVNDSTKNILLISTLHQDFNQYSYSLTKSQQNEWDKVKGRLKEITFNEPVEQLLFLAAKRIDQLNFESETYHFEELFEVIQESKLFPLRDYLNKEIAQELLPFDLLAASVLTLALQKYGQNERSLFSFIEANDPYSLANYNATQNPHYNLSNVYDYLVHNYHSFLSNRFNPHFPNWTTIKVAIERVEGYYNGDKDAATKIIKTIGLLNIFSSAAGVINPKFIDLYAKYSLGIDSTKLILDELKRIKIIHFVEFAERFKISQGTDLDIEKALQEAAFQIEMPTSIIDYLGEHFTFNYVSAKSAYYKTGTPRLFEFQLSEKPFVTAPEAEVDGYIQLVIGNDVIQEELISVSRNCNEAIIFVWYKNVETIRNVLFEILKIKKVKADNIEDKVAVNQLDEIEENQIKLLNKLVLDDLYSNDGTVQWFLNGNQIVIDNAKTLNKCLSRISSEIYHGTPIYKNELVNKTKLSTVISTSRKMMMRHLIHSWNVSNLGYVEGTFPPDKTIYLSLLVETGMHADTGNGSFDLTRPTNESYDLLWDLGLEFLNSAKHSKRNLQDFTNLMLGKPFKLKQGFIDFWLPIFLFANRNDFALFSNDIFIPELTVETLDLVSKDPRKFDIKAFDVQGIRLALFNQYRKLLEQSEKQALTNQSFIETIKPFLKFYAKDINFYSKNTERISAQSIRLRSAIALSKDPEKAFFEDFPSAMGYSVTQLQKNHSQLEKYMTDLQVSIKEIRFSYGHLIERFENFVSEDIVGQSLDFEGYKTELKKRYADIKKHFLKTEQKAFIQRINSPLDDKEAWLNSLVQVCLGKTLENITDDEEIKLYSLFSEMIKELDNLCELGRNNYNEDHENIFQIEITSFVDGLKKNLVRLPKNKTKEIENKEAELKNLLGKDSRINIAVLTNLLQNELKK